MISTAGMLAELVAFDTTSHRSNLALIEHAAAFLRAQGAAHVAVLPGAGEGKVNLHAIIGPMTEGGLALSGHVDTVTTEGQTWSSDPLRLRRENGRLYGRGTTDMKGFVASCLAAVPAIAAMPLARPVHLFLTHDEEVDASGARSLVERLGEAPCRPAFCVVGEPSGMAPIVAHKGKLVVRGRARGKPGHSSQPGRGVNALQAAAEAIAWVAAEARRFAAEGPFDPGFDPPHSTIHAGLFRAGESFSIIPEHAEFTMEWRTIPEDSAPAELERMRAHIATAIEPAMKAVDPSTGLWLEPACWYPPLALAAEHPLRAMVAAATGRDGAGKVSYATEAGLFQEAGIAAIVCGPGDIAQAHQPDEWIAESELAACDQALLRLVRQVCVSA
ncbi:acetylornithine deacetylase [Acetobacteraceae bacterium H6797]|nr:acetylornithine deacetylase [Acetobacteraceae bacterium H6797]